MQAQANYECCDVKHVRHGTCGPQAIATWFWIGRFVIWCTTLPRASASRSTATALSAESSMIPMVHLSGFMVAGASLHNLRNRLRLALALFAPADCMSQCYCLACTSGSVSCAKLGVHRHLYSHLKCHIGSLPASASDIVPAPGRLKWAYKSMRTISCRVQCCAV